MKFVQYYLDCLSQASYLIGDEHSGRAVVVDPRRDVDQYLDDARESGLTIEFVIETHFHADFLSGHLELAEATGATIVYGEAADARFPHRKVADGERIALGDVILEFRATPGHTPESISVVVWEKAADEVPYGVLTGDTLFIGDVGRPDLLASTGTTADALARLLYDSLHRKLLTLPDATRVFPAHGAGSACGKNLSTATVSTIGEQRVTNYALAPMTPEEFVAVVTEGQGEAPGYFGHDATLNREPHALLDAEAPPPLTFQEMLTHQASGAVVIDTRAPEEFARGHLRGSINVSLAGRFSEQAGAVVPAGSHIVLVGDPGRATEGKVRLARIGFDTVVGAFDGPEAAFAAHPEAVAVASRVTPHQLRDRRAEIPALVVIDVRGPGERASGAVDGSVSMPLPALLDHIGELDPSVPIVVYCAGGSRSSIAASALRAHGFADVSDLVGGYAGWAASEPSAAAGDRTPDATGSGQ